MPLEVRCITYTFGFTLRAQFVRSEEFFLFPWLESADRETQKAKIIVDLAKIVMYNKFDVLEVT